MRRMRRRGQGPRYIVLAGGSVRYLREDVEAWIAGGGNKRTKRED
jgi:predicted DNA-binding transcriptional regulator AlpA